MLDFGSHGISKVVKLEVLSNLQRMPRHAAQASGSGLFDLQLFSCRGQRGNGLLDFAAGHLAYANHDPKWRLARFAVLNRGDRYGDDQCRIELIENAGHGRLTRQADGTL